MIIKTCPILLLILYSLVSSYILRVDSVTVDSIWVSDSASRISRDCRVGFKPMGTDSVEIKSLLFSLDGASTWALSADSIVVLNNGMSKKVACNQKSTVLVRVLGGDRFNTAVKVTVRQQRAYTDSFPIPVWDSEARWQLDTLTWSGCGAIGNLDGTRRQMMIRRAFVWGNEYDFYDQQGLPSTFSFYDNARERYHTVAGNSWGYLDGPFSRARWRGQSYVMYSSTARSLDGRYFVTTDPNNGGAVRVLDLDSQMVYTLLPSGSYVQAMVMNSQGQVMALCRNGRLVTVDVVTKQIVKDITLSATLGLNLGNGRGLALDEAKGRLYASGTCVTPGNWHVWYFDLNDGGSFHGVLSGPATGPNNGYCGPFDGYSGYAENNIRFGPDDPEKRFLYMWVTDETTFMRLDLQNRVIAACSGPASGTTGPIRFVESGPFNGTVHRCAPSWLPDGSIILGTIHPHGSTSLLYRRIK